MYTECWPGSLNLRSFSNRKEGPYVSPPEKGTVPQFVTHLFTGLSEEKLFSGIQL